jgi:hypothetical protein
MKVGSSMSTANIWAFGWKARDFALKGVDCNIRSPTCEAANGTLGSLYAEPGHSIVAIKPSLIFLLFSQTKQHVSVLHGVSCIARGF